MFLICEAKQQIPNTYIILYYCYHDYLKKNILAQKFQTNLYQPTESFIRYIKQGLIQVGYIDKLLCVLQLEFLRVAHQKLKN